MGEKSNSVDEIVKKIENIPIWIDNFEGSAYLLNNEAIISINQPLEEMALSLVHEVLHTFPKYSSDNFDSPEKCEIKVERDALDLYFHFSF